MNNIKKNLKNLNKIKNRGGNVKNKVISIEYIKQLKESEQKGLEIWNKRVSDYLGQIESLNNIFEGE